ncbi:MAG: hypothetical protein HUN04_25095 [Desulfobacter sp.]|nr:MAG: hypothetical protein HUN04_25095 [Desulfobacter sp.]
MVRILLILIVMLVAVVPSGSVRAEMELLGEDTLADISGQAGITVVMDTRFAVYFDTIAISDTDSDPVNWMAFNGFSVDDGAAGGVKISNIDSIPFIMDAGTTADGRTILSMNLSPFANPISYHVEDFVFCSQSLGALDLNGVTLSPDSSLRFSHHLDGSSGVEFDAGISLDISSFDYTYDTAGSMLSLSGIHVGQTATGAAEDPSTWAMDGQFSLGNLDTSPASIDVGTDINGTTHLVFSLPFSGSIRMEDISLGGNSFGPVVLDGITAHRLTVTFSP